MRLRTLLCLAVVARGFYSHDTALVVHRQGASDAWSPELGGAAFGAGRDYGHTVGTPHVATKSRLLDGALGFECVAWRKSGNCDPSGPRDMMDDKDCTAVIGGEEAGFCECEGHKHTAALPCGHRPINCQNECWRLLPDAARTYPVTSAPPPGQYQHYERKYPMAHDMGYWAHEATKSIEQAVVANTDGLADVKRMMNSIVDSKPWAQPDSSGNIIVKEGKRMQDLSKMIPLSLPAAGQLRGSL